jgi:hypothetical protein
MLDGADTGALVLAQAAASFSRSELRWEFANTAAAVALLSAALAAITLFCFRRGTRNLTLIYFGLGGRFSPIPSTLDGRRTEYLFVSTSLI